MDPPENTIEFPIGYDILSTPEHEIFIQEFSNRLFILVSELDGCSGTILEVKREENIEEVDFKSSTYDIKVLFGKESDAVLLASRVFIEHIQTLGKPVIFNLAFKGTTTGVLHKKEDLLKISKEINVLLEGIRKKKNAKEFGDGDINEGAK